ncbi:unnamed protein product, partial [Protopolystoma xenopodis]
MDHVSGKTDYQPTSSSLRRVYPVSIPNTKFNIEPQRLLIASQDELSEREQRLQAALSAVRTELEQENPLLPSLTSTMQRRSLRSQSNLHKPLSGVNPLSIQPFGVPLFSLPSNHMISSAPISMRTSAQRPDLNNDAQSIFGAKNSSLWS